MAGSLGFLSSYGGYLRDPRVFPLGSQASFQVLRGISGFLRRRCSGIEPHFALGAGGGGCRGFSRVTTVSLGFLLSCDGDLTEPLVLPQGSQVSFLVVSGSAGLLSSHYRGIRAHLSLREGGISLCFSSCGRKLCVFSRGNSVSREPLMLPQESQACFQVAFGPQDCFQVAAGE